MNLNKLMGCMFLCCFFLLISCNSEKSRYRQALEQNTIEALKVFLKEFPNSTYTDSAKIQIEELQFYYAIKSQDIDELNQFQAKYPSSQYLDTINAAIDRVMRLDLLGYLGYYNRRSGLRLINGSDHKDQMLSTNGGVQFDAGTVVIHNYLKDKISIFTVVGKGAQIAYIVDDVLFEYQNGNTYYYKNLDTQEYLAQRQKVEQIKKIGLTFKTDINGVEASATVSGGAINFGGSRFSVR